MFEQVLRGRCEIVRGDIYRYHYYLSIVYIGYIWSESSEHLLFCKDYMQI